MAKAPGKAKAGGKKVKTALLDGLEPAEAAQVLRALLARHPELFSEAEEISRSTLGDVPFESIAAQVADSVGQVDPDDFESRAGSHSWGYTEPSEAAWELLEEAVEPFVEDMQRHLAMGLDEAALEICKGIVLGLYQCRHASGDDVLGWAEDFPAEAAGNALSAWMGDGKPASGRRPGSDRALLFRAFANEHVPEWPWVAKQLAGNKGK